MKSWKRRWKEELNGIVPALRADVKNAPVPVADTASENGGHTAVLARRPKLIAAAAVALAALCALVACLCTLLPSKDGVFVFSIEINPAIGLVADKKGTVTDVVSCNSDADVILAAEGVRENIVGKSVGDAAASYADYAARLGYLNLSAAGSAVRVSVCGSVDSSDVLNGARSALENYFTDNGVYAVVVAESVGIEEISVRCGISAAESPQALAELLGSMKILCTERQAETMTFEQLQALYENDVIENKLLSKLELDLRSNAELLQKNKEDIENLFSLYWQIYGHDDNPATLLKGYWDVIKYYDETDYTPEFAALMSAMESALGEYYSDYGVVIDGFKQLKDVSDGYASVTAEKFAALLENFSYDLFNECSEQLSEILQSAGVVSQKFASLLTLPQTAEEYIGKMYSVLAEEYGLRIKEYESAYAEERPSIGADDYRRYISALVEEYGSLSDYWNVYSENKNF